MDHLGAVAPGEENIHATQAAADIEHAVAVDPLEVRSQVGILTDNAPLDSVFPIRRAATAL